MTAKTRPKNFLTCTTLRRTLYDVIRTILLMDATAKKLVEMLAQKRRDKVTLQQEIEGLSATLQSLGYRLKSFDSFWGDDSGVDARYARDLPFKNMSLVGACKQILLDNSMQWITKNHVEYLAATGGYPFLTEDRVNSVDVTLRRLAKDGFAEVHRDGGRVGNSYCLSQSKSMEQWQELHDSVTERREIAAATKKTRK